MRAPPSATDVARPALRGRVEHQWENEVGQAELVGGGVVGAKDSSEQAVQLGADRGDGVEASLCWRCPNLPNVEEGANQIQQPFEQQHPRRGLVAGCQTSRGSKSIFRGCPQIVRAGGVERRLAASQHGSNVISNSCQRAVGVVQDLGRRPRVGGGVAVLREVGRCGCFTEVHHLELLPVALRDTHHESGRVDDDGEIRVAVRARRPPSLGAEEQDASRSGISGQVIHEGCDCRVDRVMLSKLHRGVGGRRHGLQPEQAGCA